MKTATLGDVAQYVNGAAFKEADWEEAGRRIIRIQNLNDKSKPFNRTSKEVKDTIVVRPGDLLVSWSASLGVYEWTEPDEAVLNQHIFRVVPDESKVDKSYLRRVLQWSLAELETQVHGATMKHLTRGVFLGTKIPLPPLEEQRRIAAILDAADSLRTKRRQALAKLDTLTQAIFIDMFGDPATNPMGWPVAAIENLPLHIGDGNYASKYPKASDFVSQGVAFIRASNISGNTVVANDMRFISPEQHAELKKGHLATGDVLITTRGDIGQVAIVPRQFDHANINAQIVLLRPTEPSISSHYLCYLLGTSGMRQKIKSVQTGVALKQLPIRSLKKLPLLVPPPNLQRRFTAAVESVEQEMAFHRASLVALDSLFGSLQQRAFRGEL